MWWSIPAPSTWTARAACSAAPCWAAKKWVEEVLQPFTRNTGPAISPFNAWVILKGLETLSLRVNAMCRSAEQVADFLAERPEVVPRALSRSAPTIRSRRWRGGRCRAAARW